MIRKYRNHKLQTNPWHHKEEPHYHHETPERQTKQNSQLSLPYLDYCKTRMDTKQRTTKHRTTTDPHNRSNNKQKSKTTEQPPKNGQQSKPPGGGGGRRGGGGLKCIPLASNSRP